MEATNVRAKIEQQIQHMLHNSIIKDRRFLDDEQLIRAEQLAVLEEIFNANVRDAEIKELGSHFAPILRGDHPVHLAIWGKTGTGKTLTILYFLALFQDMCRAKGVAMKHTHLDLSTPRPCFRALNDLACLLNASKRYTKGISLDEMMQRIEGKLARFGGCFVLFIDEVDNVRCDRDAFMTFLVRRLPQRVKAKLILVFASNRLDWTAYLDPRVKSFLKLNELIFEPYDAVDLQHILRIRVDKALMPKALKPGVIEKIAAMASREHGDAREAVALLARSAYLAEKAGSKVSLDLVDDAAVELDRDRYLILIRTAPSQLQAAMAAVIEACQKAKGVPIDTADAYDAYRRLYNRTSLGPLSGRAFRDLITELDMYSLIRCRVISRGRRGRARQIILDLPEELVAKILEAILMHFSLGR